MSRSGQLALAKPPRLMISPKCMPRSDRCWWSSIGAEHGAEHRILYGGSVKPDNAAEILSVPEVGGALVGGASLTADSFMGIALAVGEPADRQLIPGEAALAGWPCPLLQGRLHGAQSFLIKSITSCHSFCSLP
jgi:hypothetical protein